MHDRPGFAGEAEPELAAAGFNLCSNRLPEHVGPELRRLSVRPVGGAPSQTARAERDQFADCRRGTNIPPRRVMGTRSAEKIRWYQTGINDQTPA